MPVAGRNATRRLLGGEPCAGEPHARFGEGGLETEPPRPPRQPSTLPRVYELRRVAEQQTCVRRDCNAELATYNTALLTSSRSNCVARLIGPRLPASVVATWLSRCVDQTPPRLPCNQVKRP